MDSVGELQPLKKSSFCENFMKGSIIFAIATISVIGIVLGGMISGKVISLNKILAKGFSGKIILKNWQSLCIGIGISFLGSIFLFITLLIVRCGFFKGTCFKEEKKRESIEGSKGPAPIRRKESEKSLLKEAFNKINKNEDDYPLHLKNFLETILINNYCQLNEERECNGNIDMGRITQSDWTLLKRLFYKSCKENMCNLHIEEKESFEKIFKEIAEKFFSENEDLGNDFRIIKIFARIACAERLQEESLKDIEPLLKEIDWMDEDIKHINKLLYLSEAEFEFDAETKELVKRESLLSKSGAKYFFWRSRDFKEKLEQELSLACKEVLQSSEARRSMNVMLFANEILLQGFYFNNVFVYIKIVAFMYLYPKLDKKDLFKKFVEEQLGLADSISDNKLISLNELLSYHNLRIDNSDFANLKVIDINSN